MSLMNERTHVYFQVLIKEDNYWESTSLSSVCFDGFKVSEWTQGLTDGNEIIWTRTFSPLTRPL